jgi:hypothetical protein
MVRLILFIAQVNMVHFYSEFSQKCQKCDHQVQKYKHFLAEHPQTPIFRTITVCYCNDNEYIEGDR